jgi:hypothetical protein
LKLTAQGKLLGYLLHRKGPFSRTRYLRSRVSSHAIQAIVRPRTKKLGQDVITTIRS